MTIILKRSIYSENDTSKLAEALAMVLKLGDCLLFEGEVGAGKTTFVRSIVNVLSVAPQEVVSPTFLLMQQYDVVLRKKELCTLWHFDLYRLEEAGELESLGLEEVLDSGISCVEWPEIAKEVLPNDSLRIAIEHGDGENTRFIVMMGDDNWKARLSHLSDS